MRAAKYKIKIERIL